MQHAGKNYHAEGEPQAPLLLSHITGGGTGVCALLILHPVQECALQHRVGVKFYVR